MKLSDIEKALDPVILKRGMGYLNYENLKSVKKENNQLYRFVIKGSEVYTLHVALEEDKDTIFDTACTCPYNKGPYCKHQVAAFLYIRLKQDQAVEKKQEKLLCGIFSKLDRGQLINILLILFKRYPSERDKFIGTFHKSTKKKALPDKELITDMIDTAKGDGEFIAYYDTLDLTDDLQNLLELINEADESYEKLATLIFFYKEATQLIDCCDDSGGSVGTLLDSILDVLSNALTATIFSDKLEQLKLMRELRKTLSHPVFRSWTDYGSQLLSIFLSRLENIEVRAEFIALIDYMIDQLNPLEKDIMLPRLLLIKAAVFKAYEKEDDYLEFLNRHKALATIRQSLMHHLLEKNAFRQVLNQLEEMAKAGENIHTPNLLEIAYEAHRGLGNHYDLIQNAVKLILLGKVAYYEQTKDIISDKEAFYYTVKQALKEELPNVHVVNTLKQILLIEEDKNELLELVKVNPSLIVELAGTLKETDEDETADLFKAYILESADSFSGRKEYQQLAQMIVYFGQLFGTEAREEVIVEVKETYPRKKALIDELGKVS
ncbi:MAG: SWIM zinc finger family protein [Alkalibacterium sp.]|nr:SWIM zinc finger family protein [Alkalibacterium sp.]